MPSRLVEGGEGLLALVESVTRGKLRRLVFKAVRRTVTVGNAIRLTTHTANR